MGCDVQESLEGEKKGGRLYYNLQNKGNNKKLKNKNTKKEQTCYRSPLRRKRTSNTASSHDLCDENKQ